MTEEGAASPTEAADEAHPAGAENPSEAVTAELEAVPDTAEAADSAPTGTEGESASDESLTEGKKI